MRPLPLLALAACLLPVASAAATLKGVDAYSELLHFRVKDVGVTSALAHDTATLIHLMLANPASPYSETVEAPYVNDLWWPEFVNTLARKYQRSDVAGFSDDVLDTLHWDMGLTKARPGIELGDLVDSPQQWAPYRNQEAAASAMKASVDLDIFRQALDMTGSEHATTAAGYAVALQVLRDRLAATPADQQASRGLKADVLRRYMSSNSPQNISDNDEQYLSLILNRELNTWHAGAVTKHGLRELPAMYRVARVAAAYREYTGYVSSRYCGPGFSPDPHAAGQLTEGDNRPLCFAAATDRAVLAWYRYQVHEEAKGPPNQHHHNGVKNFMHWMGGVLAFLDFAAFVEVTEALISDSLVSEGAIEEEEAAFATERARSLTCRIRA